MRTIMREAQQRLIDEQRVRISERNQFADRLLEEKWMKRSGLNENLHKLYTDNKSKARGLAIALENQEFHLQHLSEDMISTAFQTTPHNVLRIVRLGYPNSIRDELFMDWPMETSRDAIYYLTPVKGNTKRDGTAGESIYDTFDYQWPSEENTDITFTGAIDGSNVTYTNTLAVFPIRPYTVKIYVNDKQVGADDGNGAIVGAGIDTTGTNTINYANGALAIKLLVAPPTSSVVRANWFMNSEDPTLYTEVADIQLQLRDYQFRVKPWPLTFGYSKMTELLLGTTLNIDAEEALIRGAGDELKKALDFFALRLAFRTAQNYSTYVQFDVEGAVGEAEVLRMNAVSRAFEAAGNRILDALNRGGVTKIVGGPGAVAQTKLHSRFRPDGAQPAVGAHKVGALDQMDLYKAPSAIIPNDTMLCIYKNPEIPEDVSLAFGTLIPMYVTQALEFKNLQTQRGIAHFGDAMVLNPQYIVPFKYVNLPTG